MILRPISTGQLQLSEDEIHVWVSCLDVDPTSRMALAASLSKEERIRAKKFRFRRHQNRFIARRGLLRAIVSQYLHIESDELVFEYNRYGKPEVAHQFNRSGIHFNLSHSDDMALFAVTFVGPVGIDIERIRPIKYKEEFLNRFSSPRERELFQNLDSRKKQRAFFYLWTRKEAFLKAIGVGITQLLSQVEVSFQSKEPVRFITISGDKKKILRWSIHNLFATKDFIAALAIKAKKVRIRYWKVGSNLFDSVVRPQPQAATQYNLPGILR
jgi:4'-phosphopantetheinyl transferase